MKTRLMAILVLALLPLHIAAATAQEGWLRHVDPLTGGSADVPLSLFGATPEPTEIGVVYSDPSGEVQLEIFGWTNPDRASLASFARSIKRELGDQKRFTYEKIGKTFFVQSGYLRGTAEPTIFYDRTERSPRNDRLVTFRLQYPEARRGEVDPLIRAMGNRLRRPS